MYRVGSMSNWFERAESSTLDPLAASRVRSTCRLVQRRLTLALTYQEPRRRRGDVTISRNAGPFKGEPNVVVLRGDGLNGGVLQVDSSRVPVPSCSVQS